MSYDYVVCGGGTAGCVVARRLAENPKVTVCLIEAGPSDEGNDDVSNVRKWASLLGTELDYKYEIEEQVCSNSKIIHSRARVLGGCSSINVVIAFIAPANDLDQWEQLGAHGWNSKATRKYYEKVFEKVNLQTVPAVNPLNEAFINSCIASNIPQIEMNSDKFINHFSDCCGYFQLNVTGLNRCSSSRCYLHPISSLPSNLRILTNTTVTKLIINQETMTVTDILTNTNETIKVNKECILSSGAFDTPKLLLLSGIGPAKHLQQMNIPCILNLEGVGSNLMDHPECVIIWESNYPLPDPVIQRWETALFFKTQMYSMKPDLMFHFGIEAYDVQNNLFGYSSEKSAFSIGFNVNQAKSRGYVRLKSNNYLDPPQIDCQYFSDEQKHDKNVMVAGLKLARKIIEQTPLKKWAKCELSPGSHIQSDEEIWDYCRKMSSTLFHPAGTCKMGNGDDDRMGVVDSQLKVKGIQNLRIADASVFPTMISVNPCITCMMIGEKCADMIKQS